MHARSTDGVRGFALAPDEILNLQIGAMDVRVFGLRDVMRKATLDAGFALPVDRPAPKPQGRGLHGPTMTDERPSGLIVALASDEFLMMGSGFDAEFTAHGAPQERVEIEYADEGTLIDGRWVARRRLNGDEQYQLLPLDGFGMVRIKFTRPFKLH
jgi:hypothetical protein